MDGLLGVHHVALCVTELEAARRFYAEALGLGERTDRPDFGFPGAWFDAGAQQVHLVEVDEMPEGAGRQHFALQVEDLDAAVKSVEAAGVRVYRSSKVANAGQQAFLQDPSGNGIELNQPD